MVSTTGHNGDGRLETGFPACAAFTDNSPHNYACVLRKVNAGVCRIPFSGRGTDTMCL
jgi:hypothetical protein